MATNSKIEWTDATWSPLLGCDRVSPGCDHCYAITSATIRAGNPHPKVAAAFAGLTERRDGRLDWTGRINLLPERLAQPLSWRKPRRVFVNSLADLFHDSVPDEFIAQVFAVMAATPQHTYQLLTKRHARMRSLLSRDDFSDMVMEAADPIPGRPMGVQWPLLNVWLGVSVEDQKWADIRIPALLDTPAAVHWLSCEPLLGPIDLTTWLGNVAWPPCWDDHSPSDECGCCIRPVWIVAGGESGPGARPAHPDWFRSLRDQCQAAGVAYFHKQNGQWIEADRNTATHLLQIDGSLVDRKNATTDNPYGAGSGLAQDLVDRGHRGWVRVRHVTKKAAGRELDGRTWDEYPTAVLAGAVA